MSAMQLSNVVVSVIIMFTFESHLFCGLVGWALFVRGAKYAAAGDAQLLAASQFENNIVAAFDRGRIACRRAADDGHS